MSNNIGKHILKTLWLAVFIIALLTILNDYGKTHEKVMKPVSKMLQSSWQAIQNNALIRIRNHSLSALSAIQRSMENDKLQNNNVSKVTALNYHVTKKLIGPNTTVSHVRDLQSGSNTTVSHVRDLQSRLSTIKPVTKPASVRLLCWVLCDPPDLEIRVKHVKATWASRCDVTLYMSSKKDTNFPTIGLNVTKGRSHIASKAKAAWKYIYNNYFHKAEFFMKTDPDTYVVVHNLKRYLANYDPNEPLLFGHRFNYPGTKVIYTSGGPGFVLSREAVRKLVTEALQFKVDCMPDGEFEDLKTGMCLEEVGVKVVDTRDATGRETFMVFPFNTHYTGKFPAFYRQYDMNGQLQGDQCCSHNPISFHYIKSEDMYFMDYALHKVAQAEIRAETEFIFIKKAEARNRTKVE